METTIINKKKKTVIILSITALMLILSIILPYALYQSFLKSPVSYQSREIEFYVKKGASTSTIIEGLHREGLIKNKLFAKIYVRNLKMDKSLKTGFYKFNTSMTPVQIFDKLKKGAPDIDAVNVTIPEGYTVKQIAEKLMQAGVIKSVESFLNEAQRGVFNYEFLKDIPQNRTSRLEGYLFPDTYEFKKGSDDHEVIVKFLDRFNEIYTSTIKDNLKDTNVDEIITMASIVEKEAKVQEERPVIAGVFYNRLKINMPLESCATLEYALGVHKEVYSIKDTQVESPYNTYRNPGLPIGPISNPGKKSIEAALYPEKVDYLFFVANGDGTHKFAKTYSEHLRNKNSTGN